MINLGETFPYIGLRPFSEDDSIYFKGREEHILQITALLESNKFLMVTGASGDGKSSLVYAGLVPNARAGFFKARYTNWVVSDFRPERSPLKNLSKSISRNLRIGNEDTVEVELRRGFSSLVELYKSSSLYVDDQSDRWLQAPDEEREDLQRSAANLLIVTDQFEEFFTNPENYYRNAPSADSQLVINLLLETAKIAIEKDLPIYIVCTMRSDYIGQCASFRGLPEFIGFSQFFVPRLKRKELIEVVREPSFLHGDKITNRLVERVVFDLGEGIDQLPVLEHAMNEVWIQADNGKEELDLLHYAMAGGMPAKELPAEDRNRFEAWFNTQPAKLQEAYQQTGLSRIIDTHANKLYLSAASHYNLTHDKKISEENAQLIIKVAFTCLTKMDEGRAVRNRMTLEEITEIIAGPELTWEVVGDVLNIFREPGNTFLRPYISEEPESQHLTRDSVLDITHESLIRNWGLLTSWAKEEFEHLTVYEDFKKQLDRWLTNNKSGGYLFSIGPLTYFESWFEKLNPNAYWVNRYLDPGLPLSARMQEARATIDHAREFLSRSAKKHRVTRLIVRRGAGRIAAMVAAAFIAVLCFYYYIDGRKKENSAIIQRVLTEGESMLSDPRVVSSNKAVYLICSEYIRPGSFRRIADGLPADQRLAVVRDVYTEFAWIANDANPPLRKMTLLYTDSVLQANAVPMSNRKALQEHVSALRMLINEATNYIYFYHDPAAREILNRSLADLREAMMDVLVVHPDEEWSNVNSLNDALEHLLNNRVLSEGDVEQILKSISPFEDEVAKGRFNRFFPVQARVNYNRGNIFAHNGGYQELAYLYGILGKVDNVKSCIDSLLKYNPNYPNYTIGAIHVAGYLYQYNHPAQLKEMIQYYGEKQKMSSDELFERMLNNSGLYSMDFSNKLWVGENHNIALHVYTEKMMRGLFDLYEAELRKNFSNANDLHFNLALYYKHKGALLSKMTHDGNAALTKAGRDSIFTRSVAEFRQVQPPYLAEEITIFDQGRGRKQVTRRELYLYPDHFQKVRSRAFLVDKYYTIHFLDYLVDRNLILEFYKDEKDLQWIYLWLKNYLFGNGTNDTSQEEKNYTVLEEKDLIRIDSIFTSFPHPEKLNGMGNLARLMLIREYLNKGQYDKVMPVYQRLDIDRFDSNLKEPEYNTASITILVNSFAPLLNQLVEYLASQGKQEEANRIIAEFTIPGNRIKTYADAARGFHRYPSDHPEAIFSYVDSAVTELKRLEGHQSTSTDPRIILAYGMSAVGGKNMFDLSQSIVKQLSLNTQTDIIQLWIHGIAESRDFYQAYSSIPEIAILTDRLTLYNVILLHEVLTHSPENGWKIYLEKRKEAYYQEDYGYEVARF